MEDDEIVVEVKKQPKPTDTKKKTKKKKRIIDTNSNKFGIFKTIFIIIVSIALLILLLSSSLFNIKHVEVLGNTRLSSNKVVSLSKLNIDENIFKFNKNDVKKSIKESAYVEDVSIKRKLPSTVIIEIDERIPTYMLQFTDSYVYINNQGYMLEISNDKLEIPIILGFVTDLNNIKAGNRLDLADLEKMNTVIKIYETARNSDLNEYITKIDISNSKENKIVMEELKKTVYLGDLSNLNAKMLELKEILHKMQGKEGEVFLNIDLNTQKPYFRQKID